MKSPLTRATAGIFTGCALLSLASCEVPPLQVTPQPRREVVEAPHDRPKMPAPDPAAAQVPEGYQVEIVAKDLVYPSSFDMDRSGNMYIAESGYIYGDHAAPARIWRITPDGQMNILAEQLNGPITDILLHENQLYISHKGKISVVEPTGNGAVRDLVTGLPSLGDHFNNQLAVGPDGKIYFGQGVATNSGVVGVDNFVFGWLGAHPEFHDIPARDIKLKKKEYVTLDPMVLTDEQEPPLVRTGPFQPFGQGVKTERVEGQTKSSGTILRMNTDGSGLEVFAWGLRNPFGVAFNQQGQLYAADNGYDERGSRPIANAPDCLWLVRENAWYGYPDFAGGEPVTDKKFHPKSGPKPDMLMEEHPPVEQPFLRLPHQAAVTKMEIATNDTFGAPGQIYLTRFGNMSPITGQGEAAPEVSRIDPNTRQVQPFFSTKRDALGPKNLEYAQTAGPRRLVDVRFSPRGDALYVVDMGGIVVVPSPTPMIQSFPGTGVIWRITRKGSDIAGPTNLSPLKGRDDTRPSSEAPSK